MSDTTRHYRSDSIEVTYDVKRCIHAAECVRGLPEVFDTERRPWIQPAAASADAIADVILRCPSGALHFTRMDGGAAEVPPIANQAVPTADGPLYLRGRLLVQSPDGETLLEDTRVALCRCGMSANKPFCDNAHRGGFADPGAISGDDTQAPAAPPAALTITPTANGPLKLRGRFVLASADGQHAIQCDGATLCRCGGSANKPFCDGTHRTRGFEG